MTTENAPRKLRLQHLVVQPVLVWDDGVELTPAPALGQVVLLLSQLAAFAERMPEEVIALQAQLEASAQADGVADG